MQARWLSATRSIDIKQCELQAWCTPLRHSAAQLTVERVSRLPVVPRIWDPAHGPACISPGAAQLALCGAAVSGAASRVGGLSR